ncbi:hypothetical protein B5X24_HaOG215917 [Helicoverpa armigera]|nr:hypothetical protein B5X24_HaOG215917 [Helicoverpa armigera]
MRDRLRAVFAEVIIVDVLDSQDAAHLALLQRPELGITFTKIHCWNLTQYDKCVFLDADTLVVQNCDELFEREQLSAAPDVGWPDCFNSGVFVFSPSADTFSKLITFAQERGSFDGGDQGLLNSFFSDWAHGDIKKHLPFLYNVTSAAFYSYLPALKHYGQNLKIIHFIGAAKPWLQQFNFESGSVDAPEHIRGLLQLWWDIFVGDVHSQLDTGMVEVAEALDEPLVLPPHDVRHEFHYQPTPDPESEFAWHHPDVQAKEDKHDKQIDVSEFHDPWTIYRGHIPPIADENPSQHVELVRIEDHEEIRKHRVTVDARGRKVCTHEIPPTPTPSPPDSPVPIDLPEDEPVDTNVVEDQTGVAGNLARVLPGGAGNREALDELSRRQGWEAGNIDYMGADSFANIWAKISQTLSKPRSSPPKQSPPREPAPQPAPEQVVVQSGEVVQEPVAEQVEVAKEVVPAESAAPAPAEPAPAAAAEVPVTVEAVAPAAAPAAAAEAKTEEVAAAPAKVATPVPEPAVVPVPVETAAPAPEAPAPAVVSAPSEVPVTVEAVVPDVPAPVEALASVAAAPAKPEAEKAPEAAAVVEAPKTEVPVAAAAPEVAVVETPATPASPAVASDSPPLANTPSKEEAPAIPAAKTSEEAAQETRL